MKIEEFNPGHSFRVGGISYGRNTGTGGEYLASYEECAASDSSNMPLGNASLPIASEAGTPERAGVNCAPHLS
jgi:hypothetical protein